ncbi:MAG: hypothetical protein H0V54_12485 [Chthoniobacterales bacterium]|nr:hypothetical protein [Chthoniobacterales bacterium]
MRTTLDLDQDILQAAKELATKQKSTAGKVISALVRSALTASRITAHPKNAVPVLPPRGDVITLDHVRRLMDQEGI